MDELTGDEPRYHYYVVYSHGRGYGSTEIFRDAPISDWDDVVEVTRIIEGRLLDRMPDAQIVILFWRRFEDPMTAIEVVRDDRTPR